MSGWLDTLFGNLPPQPARPTSRGATFGAGYQDMPTSTNIEDRRAEGGGVGTSASSIPSAPPPRPLKPGEYHSFNPQQWAWLQKNMPDAPKNPLPDPDFSPDPSIMARQQAMSPLKRYLYQEYPGGKLPPLPQSQGGPPQPPPMPTPWSLSGPPQPQGDPSRPGYVNPWGPMGAMGTSLNSVPWWANGMGATQ